MKGLIITCNKFVDKNFTNKNMKVVLCILVCILILFLIITPIIVEKTDLQFTDIIAPYIISISALFASTVAMINLKANELDKISDKNRKDISEIYYLMMNINNLKEKLGVYKKIVYQENQVDLYEFLEYKKLFLKYDDFFGNRILIYYAADLSTLYRTQNN